MLFNRANLIIAMQVIDQGIVFGVSDQKLLIDFKSRAMTRYANSKMSRKIIEDRLENGCLFKK